MPLVRSDPGRSHDPARIADALARIRADRLRTPRSHPLRRRDRRRGGRKARARDGRPADERRRPLDPQLPVPQPLLAARLRAQRRAVPPHSTGHDRRRALASARADRGECLDLLRYFVRIAADHMNLSAVIHGPPPHESLCIVRDRQTHVNRWNDRRRIPADRAAVLAEDWRTLRRKHL